MKFTLYHADCLEIPGNCTYPHKVEVTGKDLCFRQSPTIMYAPSIRATTAATRTSSVPTACRSTATTTTATIRKNGSIPLTLLTAFPGVAFAVHYSRNHMKEKKG
jgi:putative DNA primase/helicase